MKSAELDRLERELGLLDDDPLEGKLEQSNSIPSVRPAERRLGGCISSLWLCGIFGGCLPAAYSCWLTDYAILKGDRYAGEKLLTYLNFFLLGIYFTAALFGIYSNALLYMDGSNIRKWIDKVLSAENDWFKLLQVPLATKASSGPADFLSGQSEETYSLTWESFTRGWIHAAASTINSFPFLPIFRPTFKYSKGLL
jgi:hypothetical protein